MAWALMVMEEAGGMKDRGGRVAADSVVFCFGEKLDVTLDRGKGEGS